jgi:hypothetical protein
LAGPQPSIKVGQRPARDPALAVASIALTATFRHRWEQPEIDVHGLETVRVGSAGYMAEEGAKCGGGGRWFGYTAKLLARGEAAR